MRTIVACVVVLAWSGIGMGCVAEDGDTDPPDDPDPSGDLDPVPIDTDPVDPTLDALRVFSGCPEQADLEVNEFPQRWSALASAQGGCQTCHSTGGYGYQAITNDAATALTQITSSQYHVRIFFAATGAGDVIVNGTLEDVAVGVPPNQAHPRYDLVGTGAGDALDGVYALAHARFLYGTCGPPRY